uniref:Uncharacterized protein n=1 Tax=Cucumis melo TaxID=3656 RepID=A0A9I9ECU4_CUCME
MANAVSLIGSSTTNFSNPPLNQLLNQLASVKLCKLFVVENSSPSYFEELQTLRTFDRRKSLSTEIHH